MISAVRAITIGVSNLHEGVTLFRDVMGFTLCAQETVDSSWKQAWSIAESTRMEVAELCAADYPYGRILLAAFDPVPQHSVRLERRVEMPDGALDVGPKAIDFYVRAPIQNAVNLIKDAGYHFWSAPHRHEIGSTISEEVVFSGPDDVPLLIMVGHSHSSRQLRPGSPEGVFSEAATVSIIIGDPQETKRFYRDTLGLTIITEAESAPEFADLVADLVGAPKGTRISWITFAEPGQASGKILALNFHERTGQRLVGRMRPGALGFSLLMHAVKDLDAVHNRLIEGGYVVVTPPVEINRFGRFLRVLLVRGPNEELLEVAEYK